LRAIKKQQSKSIIKLKNSLNVSHYKLRRFLYMNYRRYLRLNKKEVKHMTLKTILLDIDFINYLKVIFQ